MLIRLPVVVESCFELTFTSGYYQAGDVCDGGTHDHFFHKVAVAWSVENRDLLLWSVKMGSSHFDCFSSLAFVLVIVQDVCKPPRVSALVFGQLLIALHRSLVDLARQVHEVPTNSRFARVDVPDENEAAGLLCFVDLIQRAFVDFDGRAPRSAGSRGNWLLLLDRFAHALREQAFALFATLTARKKLAPLAALALGGDRFAFSAFLLVANAQLAHFLAFFAEHGAVEATGLFLFRFVFFFLWFRFATLTPESVVVEKFEDGIIVWLVTILRVMLIKEKHLVLTWCSSVVQKEKA